MSFQLRPRCPKRHVLLCIALGWVGTLLGACSTDTLQEPPTARLEQAIRSGAPAPNDQAVYFVEVTSALGTSTCSAVLITPDLLLTAAHCVTGQFQSVDCTTTLVGPQLDVQNFRVSNASNLQIAPSAEFQFTEVEAVQLVSPGQPLCGLDLALIKLSIPVADVPPFPLAALPPSTESINYRAVGYGANHTSGVGALVRRSSGDLASQCLSATSCATREMTGVAGASGKPASSIFAGEFLGAAAACPGDSGGPALAKIDGKESVVGVLSRGFADCSLNVYTLAFSKALAALVRTRAVQQGYEIPIWAETQLASTSPSPSDKKDSALEQAGGPPKMGGQSGTLEPEFYLGDECDDDGCQYSSQRQANSSSFKNGRFTPYLTLLVTLFYCVRRRTHRLHSARCSKR